MNDQPKFPPHNFEAEQALLGAVMFRSSALEAVVEFLHPHHFADPTHGRIYETINRLADRGGRADVLTVKTAMDGDAGLSDLGGNAYLARLAASAVTVSNVAEYGRLIQDLAKRRELIVIAEDLVNAAFDTTTETTATSIQEEIESRLFNLGAEATSESGPVAFAVPLAEVLETAEAIYKSDGKLRGISTGLYALDKETGGLHPTDLGILAGRPSMGKTAIATNIAFNVASQGHPVAFFSLEMSRAQLAQRIVCSESGVFGNKFLGEAMSRYDIEAIQETTKRLAEIPLRIDDQPALSVQAIRTRARRMKRKGGLALIVIDYLQLIGQPVKSTGKRGAENRTQEVSEITRNLKALAKELNVPILALSQLSRQVEQREDKRPLLSDLRESGSIEQDADIVMFVYREEYYLERSKKNAGEKGYEDWIVNLTACQGTGDVIIAKQRRGPVNTVRLSFDGALTKFGNIG